MTLQLKITIEHSISPDHWGTVERRDVAEALSKFALMVTAGDISLRLATRGYLGTSASISYEIVRD